MRSQHFYIRRIEGVKNRRMDPSDLKGFVLLYEELWINNWAGQVRPKPVLFANM